LGRAGIAVVNPQTRRNLGRGGAGIPSPGPGRTALQAGPGGDEGRRRRDLVRPARSSGTCRARQPGRARARPSTFRRARIGRRPDRLGDERGDPTPPRAWGKGKFEVDRALLEHPSAKQPVAMGSTTIAGTARQRRKKRGFFCGPTSSSSNTPEGQGRSGSESSYLPAPRFQGGADKYGRRAVPRLDRLPTVDECRRLTKAQAGTTSTNGGIFRSISGANRLGSMAVTGAAARGEEGAADGRVCRASDCRWGSTLTSLAAGES